MKTIQQQIGALQTSVKRQRLLNIALLGIIVAGGFIAAVRPVGDATFDKITCKGWNVVDKDEKVRIVAATLANGQASVTWLDKDEKARIGAATFANGDASVAWLDKDGKLRIKAVTFADGEASVSWHDKDGKGRIMATTLADGTVVLPTEDLKPPKKP
jgi:hypothetical protein